jgi:proline iminopeptidase
MSRFVTFVLPVLVLLLLQSSCTRSTPPPPAVSGLLPMVEEGFADAEDDVRLFYRVVGTGRDTVIVIHGGPGLTMDYFADDLVPLAARGHVLVFYDQRGSGRSSLVSDSAALTGDHFAEDLEAIRRHFGLERVTLLGHSWGAGVVALFAARHPQRVGRVVIVGAIPMQRDELTEAFRALAASRDGTTRQQLREAAETWRADPGNPAACRAYHALWFVPFYGDATAAARTNGDFCAGPPDALRNSLRNVGRFTMASLGEWDWRPVLRRVTAPVLVIHGTVDPLPVNSAREWAAVLPNARFLPMDGIGHFPYVEAPERFFADVDAFLHGRWPQGAQAVGVP